MVDTGRMSRIRGAILGAVVGDAFAAPFEGAPRRGLHELIERRSQRPTPWRYTDDGIMVVAVAESIADAATVDPEDLFHRFLARYEPARGFGRGMKLALDAFAGGTRWEDCAQAAWPEGSRGNGGAVRIVAIAVAAWPDAADRRRAVELATRTTHAHEEALAMATLHAAALALVASDPQTAHDHRRFLALLRRWVSARALASLDHVEQLLEAQSSADDTARALGTSALAAESVPAALWAFLRHCDSFEEAVAGAARLGGDADSICCMTGALAGARHGDDAIPAAWLANLRGDDPTPAAVLELADRVAAVVPRLVP